MDPTTLAILGGMSLIGNFFGGGGDATASTGPTDPFGSSRQAYGGLLNELMGVPMTNQQAQALGLPTSSPMPAFSGLGGPNGLGNVIRGTGQWENAPAGPNQMTPEQMVTNQPFYKAGLDLGLSGVNIGEAKAGYLHSGNRATALSQYSQDYFSKNYFNLANLYAGLSGANTSPLQYMQAQYNANLNQQQMQNQQQGQMMSLGGMLLMGGMGAFGGGS